MGMWPGYRFGPYVIEDELGRGAQATVYRARDERDDRVVAVKVLPSDLLAAGDLHARFAREAKAVGDLDHPSILSVHEAGQIDGVSYICMALVDGGTLQAAIAAEGGLEPARAAHVVRQISGALDHAHEHGTVHRDVKPANVLIGADDRAFLSDFGLATVAEGVRITRTGVWVGTLEYMAPEQIRAQRVGPAADLYALAAVTYETLTGRPPFVRRNPADLMQAHIADTPRPPSSLRASLAPVDAVLARGLAKHPDDRFGSATAFAHALAGSLGVPA
jgi:eukaryotic-like serine/threonine-protein kinase